MSVPFGSNRRAGVVYGGYGGGITSYFDPRVMARQWQVTDQRRAGQMYGGGITSFFDPQSRFFMPPKGRPIMGGQRSGQTLPSLTIPPIPGASQTQSLLSQLGLPTPQQAIGLGQQTGLLPTAGPTVVPVPVSTGPSMSTVLFLVGGAAVVGYLLLK
jgi:hypothetical protein